MTQSLAPTGVAGLDYLVGGGLMPRRIYLVQGPNGSGKTTLGLQFALQGVGSEDRTLYVTLAESRDELRQIAHSHGWDLDGMVVWSPTPDEKAANGEDYTLFHPGEVELTGLITQLVDKIRAERPLRVIIDSVAEIRLMARDPLVLIRQMRRLRRELVDTGCTVLLLDNTDASGSSGGALETFAHGIIELSINKDLYGPVRRCLSIVKLRGTPYGTGQHDIKLARGGIRVYPRLIPPTQNRCSYEQLSSGSDQLDSLCGGGLETGSSAMIIGPAGTGKSTVAAHYALAAAQRGQKTSLFVFDESEYSCRLRWRSMNIPLGEYVDRGVVEVLPADPTELSPGEFSHNIRRSVVENGSRLVIIDSLSGYMQVLPRQNFMEVHLFELLKYLSSEDVLSLLVVTQHGLLGSVLESPIDVSYLIDTILLLRFFELHGEVRKAISVVKKRLGRHERTIREVQIGANGFEVGQPLSDFTGVLSGTPVYVGPQRELL